MKDSNVKEAIIEGKKLIKLTLSTVKFNDFIMILDKGHVI
jgi:hypothetical protein